MCQQPTNCLAQFKALVVGKSFPVLSQRDVESILRCDMATVLLVDDYDSQRELYELALHYAGFVVHGAADGQQALEFVHGTQPDLVVLDLSMPNVDGWEVCRRLKADPKTRGVPIIVVTAHVMPGVRESAERAGCDVFLTKPCMPEELVAAVRQHLKRMVA